MYSVHTKIEDPWRATCQLKYPLKGPGQRLSELLGGTEEKNDLPTRGYWLAQQQKNILTYMAHDYLPPPLLKHILDQDFYL